VGSGGSTPLRAGAARKEADPYADCRALVDPPTPASRSCWAVVTAWLISCEYGQRGEQNLLMPGKRQISVHGEHDLGHDFALNVPDSLHKGYGAGVAVL